MVIIVSFFERTGVDRLIIRIKLMFQSGSLRSTKEFTNAKNAIYFKQKKNEKKTSKLEQLPR